tara:strand:- start:4852 stop:5247 length:396 start_codon:yes stop_codon:yes gene_type:complete
MNDLSKMFIGFDRMFDQMFTTVNKTTYPPYNVEIQGDNKYKLSMAVAGFSSDDLTISTQKNTLSICANKQEKKDCDYTWKGIATRNFRKDFCLAPNMNIVNAKLKDGLLEIDLEKVIPEEEKEKIITIKKE